MKKLILILIIFIFNTNVLADKMIKSGFLNNKVSYLKEQKIDNPQNKILLIYFSVNIAFNFDPDNSNLIKWLFISLSFFSTLTNFFSGFYFFRLT